MGLNSLGAMNLVQGFDPAHVGIFTDVGHLTIVGEPYAMAFDIVKDYWSAIAFKDLVRQKYFRDNQPLWAIDVWPLGMGYGDFPTVMKLLKDLKFGGPISFHCEYSRMPAESIIHQCRIDTQYIQSLVDALWGPGEA